MMSGKQQNLEKGSSSSESPHDFGSKQSRISQSPSVHQPHDQYLQQQQQHQRKCVVTRQFDQMSGSVRGGGGGGGLCPIQRYTSNSPDRSTTTTTTYLNLPSRNTSRGEPQPCVQEAIVHRGEIIEPSRSRDGSSRERVIRWSSVERVDSSPSDYQLQVTQPISQQQVHCSSRDGQREAVTTLDGGDSLTLVILNCSPNTGDPVCHSPRASSSRASGDCRASPYCCQTELTIRHELVPIDHSVCQQHYQKRLSPTPDQHMQNRVTTTEIREVTSQESDCRSDKRHSQHEHYQQWLPDNQNRSPNNSTSNYHRESQPRQSEHDQQQVYPRRNQNQSTIYQIEQSYEEQMREFENQMQQSYITPQRQYTTTHHREHYKQPPQEQQQPVYSTNEPMHQNTSKQPVHKQQAPQEQHATMQSPQQQQQQQPDTSKNQPQKSNDQKKDRQDLMKQTQDAQKSGTRLVKRWDFNQQQFVTTEVSERKWSATPPAPSAAGKSVLDDGSSSTQQPHATPSTSSGGGTPYKQLPPAEKEPEPVWTQYRVPDIESVQSDPLYSDLMQELQRLEEGVPVKPEQVIIEPETFQKPIFGQKILPEHAEINEYENVEFVCRLIPISDPDMKVEWTVNGRPLIESSRYTSEYEFGVVKLRIKRCEAEDSGIYQCKATNAKGEAVATASLRVHAKGLVQCETLNPAGLDKIRQLENPKPVDHVEEPLVQQPPKFISHITDYVEKNEGDSVHFECCLGPVDDPDLKTEWFFNGRPLVTGSRFHTIDDFGFIVLDIDWLFPRDTGEYVCRATNKHGTDITRTVLRVKPAKNIVLDSQLDNSAQVIDKLRRLEFPDVEQEVYSEEPDKPPYFVQPLRVDGGRRQFVEGDNVHFEARVGPANDGNLTVEWYHNDKPLISGHRFKPTFDFGHIQLDILYVYAEDSGVYKCVAKNATGVQVESQFEIHVTGKPSLVYQSQLPKEMEGGVQKITEMEAMWNRAPDPEEDEAPADRMAPQFVLKPKPCTAFEGSCARFCCRVVGNPRPRLTWTLNGQTVVTGSRHKLTYDGMYHLTIPKCQLSDAGKVEVYARNLLGECLCSTELYVKRKVDDYRGVLKNSPNPWYDEQSLKVYQRQRSQDLTDDEDWNTFQANRLHLATEQQATSPMGSQVIGYMEPDTPDVNLLAQNRSPLVEPGDLHPVVVEQQVVMAPAPSTIQRALQVKDSISAAPEIKPFQASLGPKRQQPQQQSREPQQGETPPDDLSSSYNKQKEQQPSRSHLKGLEHVFGLDLPRYTPQTSSTSGDPETPQVDGYRSKNQQQDYWLQQKLQQEQHMARQNQLRLQHERQQKLEQQQQMAQHQQYLREKQEMQEKQQQRQQQKLQEQLELQQQQQLEMQRRLELQQQQELQRQQQQQELRRQQQLQQQQLEAQMKLEQERAQQQIELQQQLEQQQQHEQQLLQQQHLQASGQVFDPRLPPPSPESKVHGKEVHFHTHKQTQKERRGANKEILREIIDKEIFEQEHKGMTKDNIVRGSSAERGSTPDSLSQSVSLSYEAGGRKYQGASEQQQQQTQREAYLLQQQQQQQQLQYQNQQKRQVHFQQEQNEEQVLVEEYMIPPEFIQKIQPCRAVDGDEARFECTFIGDPKPDVTWFRESKMIKPSNLYTINTDLDECKSTLIIKRVTLNASAVYTVKAENVAGSAKSSANLVVDPVPAPGSLSQLEYGAVSARSGSGGGQSGGVMMAASGSSSASGGGSFLASSSSTQKSTVTTTKTSMADGGSGDASFMSDDQSSDSQKVVKSIKTRKLSADQMASLIRATSEGTLVPPTFLHTIHDINSKPGELARLDARLIGTHPLEVRWNKDGERLRADRSHKMVLEGDLYTLLILECSHRDEGLYECIASNMVGEARCEARLTVGDAAGRRSSSAMGSRSSEVSSSGVAGGFRSHSAASGSISPSSALSSQQMFFATSEQQRQTASSSSSASAAIAESSSQTAGGGQKRHYGLNKHSYSPLMTQYTTQSSSGQQEIVPKLIKRLENQQVREGKSVTLRCQISSFPIVEVHWYKQGDKPIKPSKYFLIFKDNDETYCLRILEAFPEDQGEYKCVARAPNGQTQVETKATITVIPNSPR